MYYSNIKISLSLIALSISFTACVSNKGIGSKNNKFAKNPIVAHRGAWKAKDYPQNSIASLQHAIELKNTGSEFDVRMTVDDSLVINHDPHFNDLLIEETKYSDLVAHKLSNGEKLPTLREYLLAGISNNTSTRLVCEIKPPEHDKTKGITATIKTVELVKKLQAQNWMVYISFDYEILKQIRKLDPTVPLQYLEGNKSPEEVKADKIQGIDYHFSVFKKHPEWIESAKKNKILLNAWTVNEPQEMDWLISQNFDFITTNEPELLAERIQIDNTTKK